MNYRVINFQNSIPRSSSDLKEIMEEATFTLQWVIDICSKSRCLLHIAHEY